MVTKCIEYLNCPTEMGLYLDAPTPTTIHLKNLIECQYVDGIIPSTLTLTFTIAPHASVTIIDDLCCCSNQSAISSWHNTLSFYLHNNSMLTYRLEQPAQNCHLEKELNFILLGKHAQAHAICSCTGSNDSIFNFKTTQQHKAPQTTSSLIIKGALTDQARIKSNALIKVYKNCNTVHASQINKNLLLNPGTRALSIPKLEIETDDVHCRHDAMVSKLNPEQLFYLQSRGISAEQAQKDLIAAFLA